MNICITHSALNAPPDDRPSSDGREAPGRAFSSIISNAVLTVKSDQVGKTSMYERTYVCNTGLFLEGLIVNVPPEVVCMLG